MKIKLSDINSLKKIHVSNKWMDKAVIIVLAIVLAIGSWFILKSVSTMLVIKKDKSDKSGKKNCDFN